MRSVFVLNLLPIIILLVFNGRTSSADPSDGCQILQTTDYRTPCYIFVQRGQAEVPSFLYMLNIPRPVPEKPCPVTQTIDSTYSCYAPPRSSADPAFILNVPVPPNADYIDESPAGIAKLRKLKNIPIFRRLGLPGYPPPGRQLGPPSPLLTMAVFKPFKPTQQYSPPPVVRNGIPTKYSNQLEASPSPAKWQSSYVIVYPKSTGQQPAAQHPPSTGNNEFPYPTFVRSNYYLSHAANFHHNYY